MIPNGANAPIMSSQAFDLDPEFAILKRFQSLSAFQSATEVAQLVQFLSLRLPAFHRLPEAQAQLKSALSLLFTHIFTLVVQTPELAEGLIALLRTIMDFDKGEGKHRWAGELAKALNVKTQLTLLEMELAMRGEVPVVHCAAEWQLEEWRPSSEECPDRVPARRKNAEARLADIAKRPFFSERLKLVLPLNFALVQFVPLATPQVAQTQRFEGYLIEVGGMPYKLTLRPGLDAFLSDLTVFADLHLYAETSAEEVFKVLEVIDPGNKHFQKRVVTTMDANRKKSKQFLPLSDDDLELTLILDTSIEAWADMHEYIVLLSPFAPSAIPTRLPLALDYKLIDTTFGVQVTTPMWSPTDWNQFVYLKAAVKQAYVQFLAHKSEYTAIYEFREFRKKVMEDSLLHFQTYFQQVGVAPGYTMDRYRTLRCVVRELGAIETDGSGLEVVEGEPKNQAEISADSILRAYYRCSRL